MAACDAFWVSTDGEDGGHFPRLCGLDEWGSSGRTVRQDERRTLSADVSEQIGGNRKCFGTRQVRIHRRGTGGVVALGFRGEVRLSRDRRRPDCPPSAKP